MAGPKGPLANSPRDLKDDFVGAPAEHATGGTPPRWPPNPKRVTTNTFHAKVDGDSKKSRADRAPHFRKGGWVGGMKDGGWMKGAVKHPGGLHRSLGVPEGEKIPTAKIEKAAHSSNPKVKKQAVLAETFAKHRPK